MITVSKQQIVAQPNCSASWRHNQYLLIAFSLWGLGVSLIFALKGAWLILPIISVELLLLAVVLMLVCKKIHQRHVLRFQQQQLTIEKGTRCPARCWQVLLRQTRISVERQQDPCSPLKIQLCTPLETIPVGDFLNHQDSHTLLNELRQKGLSVCNDSEPGSLNS